jgi:hydroxymethylpyrimidine/phosphomethylpyrimidine kinase
MSQPPVALTIAGSDSGGGAGIQADLKSFAAHLVFGTSAVTALTAQNTTGVTGVHAVPTAFVVEQVEAVLADLPVAAVKTGMLATTEIIRAVARLAEAGRLPNLVVDPVMITSSGDRLLSADAQGDYVRHLFPVSRVVTPNLHEAEVLVGAELASLDDVRHAARELARTGCEVVVIKGGHPTPDASGEAVDVWCDGRQVRELRGPRIDATNTHGTGCTFAAAVAARLAHGDGPADALSTAKAYVARAMAAASHWRLGAGHGPLDHFCGGPHR